MKRIAILLAAVGLGSGCVVSTCDSQTLTIDTFFINTVGAQNRTCDQALGLYGELDVYIDGTLYAQYVPCDDLGVVLSDVPTGVRRVVVEGYDQYGAFISRDWADLNIDSCGDTYWAAQPGEGYVVMGPTSCVAGNGYLLYSLIDYTRSASGYEFQWIRRSSGAPISSFTCNSPIYYAIPYGDYRLNGLENVLNTSTTYAYACTPIDFILDFMTPTAFSPDRTYVDVVTTTGNVHCAALN